MPSSLMQVEQREVNGLFHLLITCIARMQMVSTIVFRSHVLRIFRITYSRIEFDNHVKLAAGSNPSIVSFALRLACGCVIKTALERSESSTVNANAMIMRTFDHLDI